MARGDIIVGSATSTSYVNIQPPVGEEWMITHVGCEEVGGTAPDIYSPMYVEIIGTYHGVIARDFRMPAVFKVFINNGNYLRLGEASNTAISYYVYSGIKLK